MSGFKLYRHYNSKNELLYVGISLHILDRLMCHRNQSPWFSQVAKITIEDFKNIQSLRKAEKLAIKKEIPIHNHQFNVINQTYLFKDSELANYLRISLETIKEDIKNGVFPFVAKIKRPRRWMKKSIDIFMFKKEVQEYLEARRFNKTAEPKQ